VGSLCVARSKARERSEMSRSYGKIRVLISTPEGFFFFYINYFILTTLGVSLWTNAIKNEAALAATEISHNVQPQIDNGVQMQYRVIREI
jgi:hypothetical protein